MPLVALPFRCLIKLLVLELKINKLKFGAGRKGREIWVEQFSNYLLSLQIISCLCGCKRVYEGPLVKFGVAVSVTPIAAVSDSKLNFPLDG